MSFNPAYWMERIWGAWNEYPIVNAVSAILGYGIACTVKAMF